MLEWLANEFPDNPDTQTLRNWAARPMTAYNLKPGSANDNERNNATSGWPDQHLPPRAAVEAANVATVEMQDDGRPAPRNDRDLRAQRHEHAHNIRLTYLIAQFLNSEGHYVHQQLARTPLNPNDWNIPQGQIPKHSTLSHLLAGRLPGARAFLNHMADPSEFIDNDAFTALLLITCLLDPLPGLAHFSHKCTLAYG